MRRFLLLGLCLCACSDIGLGVPGTGMPLPPGGLPRSQTLEGGAQLQISPAGMAKLEGVAAAMIHDRLEQGFCVAQQGILGSDLCFLNQGACSPGCSFAVDLIPTGIRVSVTSSSTLNVSIEGSIGSSVRIDPPIFSACTLSLSSPDFVADVDVGLSIDPATGALGAEIAQINTFEASDFTYTGCASVPDLDLIMVEFLDTVISKWVTESLAPALNDAIAYAVPSPRELAALVDLPALALVGAAASNGSLVETRVMPGGYAQLANNAASLGVVTGFNSDSAPETRVAGLASEPDPCVAGLAPPDLGAPPDSLPVTSRGSFALAPAGLFVGQPMPADDFALGISRTALDLAGHHLVASGGLCLDVAQIAFLRRDVLDDLLGLPLAASDAELRLVVRPQQPLRFGIGTLPHLNAVLDDLQVDVERVSGGIGVPMLRVSADVALGSQLVTRRDAGLPARLESTRMGLSIADPAVTVFDARYAGLNPVQLATLASTVIDVAFAAIGADAGTFLVPGPAGGYAANLRVEPVTTASDDFLAVFASIGAPPVLDPAAPAPQPSSTDMTLPTPAELRTALLAGESAALPALHVMLPTSDGARPLEHAWRTQDGPWHPYEATGDLVVRDRSFAWQGERTIELRSRVVGDDGTTSPTGSTGFVIDYAPPTLFVDQLSFDPETFLVVPARDALGAALEWAMGPVGESEPTTEWSADPNLDAAAALALGNDIVVYVRDDAGHVAQTVVHVPEPNAAALAMLAVALLAWRARRSAA